MTDTATTSTIARLILSKIERTSGLADGLTQGIDQKTAACKPMLDGKEVDCNHPTFIFGHLSIYPQEIMTALEVEPGDAAVPASYLELFKHGAECKHDAENSVYPSFEEVLGNFRKAYKAVHAHIATLDDEFLTSKIENIEWAADFFGTRDSMSIFMLHDHYMFHLGQLSTWRRCMGLGSVM